MKLAAMEGLYDGQKPAPLVAFGLLNSTKRPGDKDEPFFVEVKIPGLLSLLANRKLDSFVPGINDLVYGNQEFGVTGVEQRMASGRIAVEQLDRYKKAMKSGDEMEASSALSMFDQYKDDLGYGHLKSPTQAAPPVPITYYSFHIMVILGTLFPLLFLLVLFFTFKGTIEYQRWLLTINIFSIILSYIASQAGWVVAEVGRQPWAIQGLLPVTVANTSIASSNVQTTFFIFLTIFTLLLIAAIRIMLKQIELGPEE